MPATQSAAAATSSLTVSKTGRRFVFTGNTYAHKDAIKAAGCKWDPEARCWYTGKAATADAVLAKVAAAPPAPITGAPTMLPSRTWGVRVFGAVAVGDTVIVKAKSGAEWTTTVSRVVSREGNTTVVETPPKAPLAPARTAAAPSYTAPRYKRAWRACGYPGCTPHHCDECSQ